MASERLSYFVVIRQRGGPWDWERPLEEQELWPAHARFMDNLVSSGFIILGGPLGEDGRQAMLVVDAESEEAVHSRLAPDPWTENGMLTTASIEPWTIRLDARR